MFSGFATFFLSPLIVLNLGNKSIFAASASTLEAPLRPEVARKRKPRNIRIAFTINREPIAIVIVATAVIGHVAQFTIHRDAEALVIFAAAKIGRVDQFLAVAAQLRHEGILAAGVLWLEGPLRGEVGRIGKPCHIGIAFTIHRDPAALV